MYEIMKVDVIGAKQEEVSRRFAIFTVSLVAITHPTRVESFLILELCILSVNHQCHVCVFVYKQGNHYFSRSQSTFFVCAVLGTTEPRNQKMSHSHSQSALVYPTVIFYPSPEEIVYI